MDIINDRYRVIKKINDNRVVSSYLVCDILSSKNNLQLNILNSEYISEKLLQFYKDEFRYLVNIKNTKIVRVFDFGRVYSIDSKKLINHQYYYTNEYYKKADDILSFVKNISKDKLVDLFIEICQGIHYLHLKGYVYNHIDLDNILLVYENDKAVIKIKDIATVKLNNESFWGNKEKQFNYNAPELYLSNNPNMSSDIFSLGIIMLELMSENLGVNFKNYELSKVYCHIKQESSSLSFEERTFIDDMLVIIAKMTEDKKENRYKYVNDIVNDINKIFNKEYIVYKIDEVNKLNLNTKIVGRENFINDIMSEYNFLMKYQSDGSIFLVHGEAGIGKTRFLKEIEYLMELENENIYSSFSLQNINVGSNKAIIEILKKIIGECECEILEKYSSELVKIVPEIGYKKNIKPSENLSGEKEKFRLISSVFRFINDFSSEKPMVFIIDNLHLADTFTIDVLEYAMLRQRKNMMFVVSYSEGDNNSRLDEFLQKVKGLSKYKNIYLQGLNSCETSKMMQHILNMHSTPLKFGNKIYMSSYGNPLFTEEIIKNLYSEQVLYIDKQTGFWSTNYKVYDYDKISLPLNIEQAILNQITKLDKISYEVLSVISIFNFCVSLKNIISFFNNQKEVKETLQKLEYSGVLRKIVKDRDIFYDFYNKTLKSFIYNKLNEDFKIEKHKKAIEILQNEKLENKDCMEELIYHLEKSGKKDELVKCCIENAKQHSLMKNRMEAIKNLNKAISIFSEDSYEEIKIELLMEIGSVYSDGINIASASNYYEEAYKLAKVCKNKRYEIDALNKLASMYYYKNDIDKAEECILRAEEILMGFLYDEGELINKNILADIYVFRQEYNKALSICSIYIDKCKNKYLKYKGNFYITTGNIFIELGDVKKALENFNKGIECFEIVGFKSGIARALNNIGVIYADYIQDIDMALSYFEELKILSEDNYIELYEVLASVNIGEAFFYRWEYEKSKEYFEYALSKSEKIGYETYVFYCYSYLSNINLRINNYSEAYKCFMLAQKKFKEYSVKNKEDMRIYYRAAAEIYCEFGDLNKAQEFIEKSAKLYNKNDSKNCCDNNILYQCIQIIGKNNKEPVDEYLCKIESTLYNSQMVFRKIDKLYDVCIYLIENNKKISALKLFKIIENVKNDVKSNKIQVKRNYIKIMLKKNNNKLKELNSQVILLKKENDLNLLWRVYYNIANCYFDQKNYYYAINYYFEACEIVKKITNQIPRELRLNFVNLKNMVSPFYKISLVKKYSGYNEKSNSEDRNDFNIKSLEDLKTLFRYDELKDIITNKYFINSARKIYNVSLELEAVSINEIIQNLHSDSLKNLEMMLKYAQSITLATYGAIISDSRNMKFTVISSTDKNQHISNDSYIFKKARELKKEVLITDDIASDVNLLNKNVKAAICIPIILKNKIINCECNDRRCIYDNKHILGYIYLESEKIINDFNIDSLEKCTELSKLIGVVLENYNLDITASIDKLTGIYTRKYFDTKLSDNIERANELANSFSLIMFDLDYFKDVNDRFGHKIGDEVLAKVCNVVSQNVRKEDVFARYGGEEFMIILPDTDLEGAKAVAERIRRRVEEAKILRDKRDITISMGLVTYPEHGEWKQEIIEKVDAALYYAKESGKNQCQIWSNEFSTKVKGSNKLTGVISGNPVEDSRKTLVMVEIAELIEEEKSIEEKVYCFLGRMIETMEVEYGTIFLVEDNKISKKYQRKVFCDDWQNDETCNESIVKSVIDKKQGIFMVDWDQIVSYDIVTGMPEWQSVLLVPMVKNGEVRAVLYLSALSKVRDFKFNDFNFVSTLCKIGVGMF